MPWLAVSGCGPVGMCRPFVADRLSGQAKELLADCVGLSIVGPHWRGSVGCVALSEEFRLGDPKVCDKDRCVLPSSYMQIETFASLMVTNRCSLFCVWLVLTDGEID